MLLARQKLLKETEKIHTGIFSYDSYDYHVVIHLMMEIAGVLILARKREPSTKQT